MGNIGSAGTAVENDISDAKSIYLCRLNQEDIAIPDKRVHTLTARLEPKTVPPRQYLLHESIKVGGDMADNLVCLRADNFQRDSAPRR